MTKTGEGPTAFFFYLFIFWRPTAWLTRELFQFDNATYIVPRILHGYFLYATWFSVAKLPVEKLFNGSWAASMHTFSWSSVWEETKPINYLMGLGRVIVWHLSWADYQGGSDFLVEEMFGLWLDGTLHQKNISRYNDEDLIHTGILTVQKTCVSVRFCAFFQYPRGQEVKKAQYHTETLATQTTV